MEGVHHWKKKGIYEIRVKSIDMCGAESPWSDPLVVTMSKNKLYIIFTWLQLFLENHPVLFQIFKYFLRP